MLKGVSIIFLSLAMSLATLAPSALLLLNIDANSVTIVEITEEENKRETKKQLDEHKIINRLAFEIAPGRFEGRTKLYLYFKEEFSNPFLKIHLPPPEFIS
ncbi:hypothetical protein ATE92_1304 [Ulvibacter sp. MAR_2010_11]|uniref:hypothetical protein n=1 Tax=Ulvibacter sp. MAR_2010_11 TaxID=1250229 RepID=UPI000C2CB0F7|nr:hypothetical protein [Ulvibacter sp. MAR_2010_11]PKA83156.1 hypothetical protein ATE92_1304 [Ulvibacter sp. MAR_2010_11]